jgi:serine O-acetyltransferase
MKLSIARRAYPRALFEVLAKDFASPMNQVRVARLTLVVIRLGEDVHNRRLKGLPRLVWRLGDVVWLRLFMSAEFPPSASIGPGLGLPHGGRGVSIAAGAVIGANCTIHPFVTIGQDPRDAPPRLDDEVVVATGARILGDVTVGLGAHVGANSVVIRDVPPGATAFGVPARLLRRGPADPEPQP